MKKNYNNRLGELQKINNKPKEIKYKRFDSSKLEEGTFERIKLNPDSSGYLSEDIIESIYLSKSNTVFINTNTGTGKSTSIYGIIKKAYDSGEYKIIVASPKQTLVEKDYQYLTDSNNDFSIPENEIVHYSQINSNLQAEAILRLASSPVHVMTISCLFGNSGNNIRNQSKKKQNYLQNIKQLASQFGKKILIIIDELHDAINYVEHDKFHWLSKLDTSVHKIIIATATYTESCYPFIMDAVNLSGGKLKILEDIRVKKNIRNLADMEFFVCRENAFSSNERIFSSVVNSLFERININKKGNSRLHILCATKTIAERIYDGDWLEKEETNLTVGGGDNKFNPAKNNVGTTFVSGVNISSGDTLVIILPFTQETPNIFTLGRCMIDQALARLRGKGKIIVVAPPLNYWMEEEDYQIVKNMLLPQHLVENISTNDTNKDYEYETVYLKKQYDNTYPKVINGNSTVVSDFSFEDYQFSKGDRVLANSLMISGKWYYPYLVWAAVRGNISNCNAPKFKYQSFLKLDFYYDKQAPRDSIIRFLIVNFKHLEAHLNFESLDQLFFSLLSIFRDGCSSHKQIIFNTYGTESMKQKASTRSFKQNLLSVLIQLASRLENAGRGEYLIYRGLIAKSTNDESELGQLLIEMLEILDLVNRFIAEKLDNHFPTKKSFNSIPDMKVMTDKLDEILNKLFTIDEILKSEIWEKPSAYILLKKHCFNCSNDTTYQNIRVSKIETNVYNELKKSLEDGIIDPVQFEMN